MVDYYKETGTNPNPGYKGSMMIRDTGTHIEFRIKAGSVNTQHVAMPFGWTVNGSTGTSTKPYPAGGKWLFLRSFAVSTSQTVTFRLFATGTEGLGGPTTFSVTINRGTKPGRPDRPQTSQIDFTQMMVTYKDGPSGGPPITERQIGYSTNSAQHEMYTPSDGSTMITGLVPGRRYFFWARNKNSWGWSEWSLRGEGTTRSGADIKYQNVWHKGIPWVRVGGVWKRGLTWVKHNDKWKRSV